MKIRSCHGLCHFPGLQSVGVLVSIVRRRAEELASVEQQLAEVLVVTVRRLVGVAEVLVWLVLLPVVDPAGPALVVQVLKLMDAQQVLTGRPLGLQDVVTCPSL